MSVRLGVRRKALNRHVGASRRGHAGSIAGLPVRIASHRCASQTACRSAAARISAFTRCVAARRCCSIRPDVGFGARGGWWKSAGHRARAIAATVSSARNSRRRMASRRGAAFRQRSAMARPEQPVPASSRQVASGAAPCVASTGGQGLSKLLNQPHRVPIGRSVTHDANVEAGSGRDHSEQGPPHRIVDPRALVAERSAAQVRRNTTLHAVRRAFSTAAHSVASYAASSTSRANSSHSAAGTRVSLTGSAEQNACDTCTPAPLSLAGREQSSRRVWGG